MEWYYAVDKQQIGPVSEEAFNGLVNNGTITAQTLVWNSGLKDWVQYSSLQNQTTAAASASITSSGIKTSFCYECGKSFPEDEMISYQNAKVCAGCKPIFIQKIKEGISITGAMVYGGFWLRFGAKFIDNIITIIASMIINGIITAILTATAGYESTGVAVGIILISLVINIGIPLTYSTWFLGKFGATPGKMACGLKVVRPDGSSITYARALGRHFAEMLSSMILFIGYIMAAFDDEKRTLHDRICDTRVVKK